MDRYEIDFEPIGLRAVIRADQTILDAAQSAGIQMAAVCGGHGTCGACRIRLMEGQISGPAADAFGFNLACQCKPLSDLKIEIPPESLSTQQRLQLEGSSLLKLSNNPVIRTVSLSLNEPTIADLRADSLRIREALAQKEVVCKAVNPFALQTLSDELRRLQWQVRAVLRREELIAVLAAGEAALGLAVDIGTTGI